MHLKDSSLKITSMMKIFTKLMKPNFKNSLSKSYLPRIYHGKRTPNTLPKSRFRPSHSSKCQCMLAPVVRSKWWDLCRVTPSVTPCMWWMCMGCRWLVLRREWMQLKKLMGLWSITKINQHVSTDQSTYVGCTTLTLGMVAGSQVLMSIPNKPCRWFKIRPSLSSLILSAPSLQVKSRSAASEPILMTTLRRNNPKHQVLASRWSVVKNSKNLVSTATNTTRLSTQSSSQIFMD